MNAFKKQMLSVEMLKNINVYGVSKLFSKLI